MTAVYIYGLIIVINLLAFIFMALDKWFAVKNKWRISEATLLAISALGGSLGALVGMTIWRHKINKPKFRFGVPAIVCVHSGILFWLTYIGRIKLNV